MAMKKIITILALTFVLSLGFLTMGLLGLSNVAQAQESDVIFAYVAPADLENNPYAGQSNVAVIDDDTGDVLFYLIESYYYPATAETWKGETYFKLAFEGLNASIDTENLVVAPKTYDGVTLENALPSNLLLKEGVTFTIGSHTVDSTWTVKLMGMNEDDFFVQASFGEDTIFGLVEKTNFTTEEIAYHQIDEAIRQGLINKTPDEEVAESGDASKSTLLRIILIVGIAVPAVIIAIMLFKPGRNSAKTNYDRHAMRSRRDDDVDYDRDRSYDRDRDYSRRESRDYDREYRDRDYRDRRDDRDYRRDDRDYRDRRDDRDYDRRDRDDRDYRRDDRDYDRRY